MKNKNLVALTIVAIVGSVFASTFYTSSSIDMSHVSALYQTSVVTQVMHNGVWGEPVLQGSNLVVNSGLNWTIPKIFGTGGGGSATVMGLGNYTNAEQATLLTINATPGPNSPIVGCGLDVATISGSNLSTASSGGVANQSLTWTWQSSCTIRVNTTALYNSSTMSGFGTTTIMFAGKNFASNVDLTSGDQLNVTWYVWATSV